tara:strand:+ start:40 stop:282 length:243 start_codon:yes stop_codon:yes gene_type:complete
MKKYKTKNGLISLKRFSNIQRIDIFPNEYAIKDYKTKKFYPIEKISIGRWKFFGKYFNKLSDINWRNIQIGRRRVSLKPF